MKNRPSVNLESIDTLFGIDGTDGTVEVAISDIKGFKDHPFLVLDDENMENLVESVREFGVLTPVMLRESADGNYEMISGHRRMHAATIVGLEKLPAIIKELTDDEAVCLMVDSNIQREKLLPSEKAFAYKMKLEAMKRQSGRPSKENVCHSGTHLRSDAELSSQVGESARTIQRYIRLTELIPELLSRVDREQIGFINGVELSYINKEIQAWIEECIDLGLTISEKQIKLIRKRQEEETLTQPDIMKILMIQPKVKEKKDFVISEKKLFSYFSEDYSMEDMEQIIYGLLDEWKKNNEDK